MTFQTFHLHEHGGWQENSRMYSVIAVPHPTEEARDEALASRVYPLHVASHTDALQKMRQELEGRKERLLSELRQVEFNLSHLSALYPAPKDLLGSLREARPELLEQFRSLMAKKGRFKLGVLEVTNDYLSNSSPELFVFNLPQYGPSVQLFSEEVCEFLRAVMDEVGLYRYSEWNGPGTGTWSVRARV